MAGKTPEELIQLYDQKRQAMEEQIETIKARKEELLTMIESGSDFREWLWEKASAQEKRLWERMCDFGDYFSDMRFDEDSITYEYLKAFEGDDADTDSSCPLPDELGNNFTYNWFRIEVKEFEDGSEYIGSYNAIKLTLCVSPDHVDDDIVLLHELIHLHEHVINDLPWHYHDILYWALYQDLRTKIIGLDDAIKNHAHLLNESQLHRAGGTHDILFLLKSFDLDIRKGYPLGTVFGYGRVDEFKYLKKITT